MSDKTTGFIFMFPSKGHKTWVLTSFRKYELFWTIYTYFAYISLFFSGSNWLTAHISEHTLKLSEVESVVSESHGPTKQLLTLVEKNTWLVQNKMKVWEKTGSNPHRKVCNSSWEGQQQAPSAASAQEGRSTDRNLLHWEWPVWVRLTLATENKDNISVFQRKTMWSTGLRWDPTWNVKPQNQGLQ